MRIILAAGAMRHDHHQWSKTIHQPDVAQQRFDTIELLILRETDAWLLRCRLGATLRGSQLQLAERLRIVAIAQFLHPTTESERKKFPQQRQQRCGAAAAISSAELNRLRRTS